MIPAVGIRRFVTGITAGITGRSTGTVAAVVGLVSFLLFTAACAPASGPPRGFGSRQIVMVRDPSLNLRAFSEDASQLYLARDLVDAATVRFSPPYNRSLLNLTTGEDRPVAEAVVGADFLPGGPGRGRTLVLLRYTSATDALASQGGISSSGPHPILSLIDEQSQEQLDIPDLAGFPILGATRADPMVVRRAKAGGAVGTWFGFPDNLRPVGIDDILGVDATGAFARLEQADPVIVHANIDGSKATVVAPFQLGEHVAVAGDIPAPAAPAMASLGTNIWYACPRLPDGRPGRCFLLFSRDLTDEISSLFVRFVDDPREMALPGSQEQSPGLIVAPSLPLLSPRGQTLTWLALSAETGARLFSWSVGSDHAGSCVSLDGTLERVTWTSAEDRFAVLASTIAGTAASETPTYSWTLFTGPAGEACRAVASGSMSRVTQHRLSPDGNLLARLARNADGTSAIHVSAFDGTADTPLAVGADFEDISFLDDRRLELLRGSADGAGLSWLDPTAASAPEHPIAERVTRLTSSIWLNARWLLVGHSYSAQDDTFTLSAIDTQTGRGRDVSAAVTDFRVPWTSPPEGATEVPIVYIVRGRVASAQDGIWLARLPLADFPSEL